jgi:uncharacterized protein YqeY
MTSLKETLKSDLTVAMKASDDLTKSTLRMALSAITNAEVAGDEVVELSDDQIVKVLQAESKKRLESAEIYEQNGRAEAAAKEKAEAEDKPYSLETLHKQGKIAVTFKDIIDSIKHIEFTSDKDNKDTISSINVSFILPIRKEDIIHSLFRKSIEHILP